MDHDKWPISHAMHKALTKDTAGHQSLVDFVAERILEGDEDLEGYLEEAKGDRKAAARMLAAESVSRGWTDAAYWMALAVKVKDKEAQGDLAPVEGDDYQKVKAIVDNFFTRFPELKGDQSFYSNAEWQKKEGPESHPSAVAVLAFEGPFYREVNDSNGRRLKILLDELNKHGYTHEQDHAWDMGFYKKA